MNQVILDYIEKNKLAVMKIIYENKYVSFSDLIGYTYFNMFELNAILNSLYQCGYIIKSNSDNEMSYYLTKRGCFDYLIKSNPNYVNGIFEKFRRADYNIFCVERFLTDSFYDMYKNDIDVNIDSLFDDFYNYGIRNDFILVKNTRF